MNLLDRLAHYPDKLTKRETVLVDYILAGYPQRLLDSAASIGASVGVSASTVVRLFSKLNYSSLAEVQDEARLVLASKLASPSQRAQLAPKSTQGLSGIVERVLELDQANLNATIQSLDLEAFQALVRSLTSSTARRIYLIGAKNSVAVVQYLHIHLNMCLPDVRVLSSGATMADELLWCDRHDVVMAVSVRRYTRSVLEAMRYFRQIGATIGCISDSPLSPVARLAHHRLLIHTASASPFDSYTSAFSVANMIVAAVASRRQKEVEEALKRGDALWDQFSIFNT